MSAAGATSGLYVNVNTGTVQAGVTPFRNALINGDMRINQRGTSTNLASMTAVATSIPGSWVVDRWNVYRNAYAAGASMGQGTNLSTSDLPFQDSGIQTYARIQRVSGNTSTAFIACSYNLESQDSRKFAGKTVTLSFYYRTGANFSGSAINAYIYSGTGTDEGLRGVVTGYGTVAENTVISTSTTWRRVVISGTVASTANQLFIAIQYIPVGTAGANDYMDITGVQLELGSVATPFEVRPYPVELALCQRYYEIILSASFTNAAFMMGTFNTGSATNLMFQFVIPKRSTPSLAVGSVSGAGGTVSSTVITIENVRYIMTSGASSFYYNVTAPLAYTAEL